MVIYDIELIFHLTNKTMMKRQNTFVLLLSFSEFPTKDNENRPSSASMITNDVSEQKLPEMQTQTLRYMMQK